MNLTVLVRFRLRTFIDCLSIFSTFLFWISILFLSSLLTIRGYKQKDNGRFLLLMSYVVLLVINISLITNVQYLYLLLELINISIYVYLVNISYTAHNYKASIYYYFVRFVSSLLFICALYDVSNSQLNSTIINISILLKLRLAPFTKVIPYVYKNSSFNGYLYLSYYVNYVYITILAYVNTFLITPFYDFLIFLSVFTVTSIYLDFLKKYEVKSLVAYSSITNLPIILCAFPLLQIYTDKYSLSSGATLLSFVIAYISVYSNNILILNLYSYLLEPVKGKK